MSVTVLIEVLLAALVLFGVAAAATGRLPGLAEVPADDAGDGLPEGPLRAPDLELARFPLAFRGYRMADVDRVLDRLAGELMVRDAEIARMGGVPVAPDDAQEAPPQTTAEVDDGEPVAAHPAAPYASPVAGGWAPLDDGQTGATRAGEPPRLDET